MSSSDEGNDRVAIARMNTELRQAQLEMLSAQCATDRLRLRYSAEDMAQHAQREVLRKAWSSANALFEYYNGIVKHVPNRDAIEKAPPITFDEAKVLDATARVARYLHEQREYFWAIGQPLEKGQRDAMTPFFSPALLHQARVVVLDGQRIPNPPFYAEARAMGFANLPDLTHMFSVTFEDVLVFPDKVTNQRLFHALVHVVQVEVLGLNAYAERFVRGFLRTRLHTNTPLEVHAAMLETAFAEQAQPFSVEEKVRLWTNQGRY
jgi:hypothetical protein